MPKPHKHFNSNMVINAELLKFLGKYETKRADQRVYLIPDPEKPQTWLAYHPKNPKTTFKPKGIHAFVTHHEQNPDHPQHKKIAAWPITSHKDTFHVGLSQFSPDLDYAGEVLFSQKGEVRHYDNASGTYNPKEEYKEQAGFPVAKFVKPTFSF